MKVGDLVRFKSLPDNLIALVIKQDDWATLVQWCNDDEVEDTLNYGGFHQWEVVSESR